MKIGIEAQRIFRRNKHGMDYVVLQEIRHLQAIDTRNEYFIFVKPGPDRCVEEKRNFSIIELSCPTYPLWEQWALPSAAKRLGVDILHCTSNTAPVMCDIPLVLTLHDIIFLEPRDKNNKSIYQNMGWLYRRMVVPKILDKCKRIITVSNYEYENIINKLSIPSQRMAMIYNGYNEWFCPIDDKDCRYGKYIRKKGFFFFLGNTDPKKNTERTIVAYAKYLKLSKIKRQLLVADLSRERVDEILRLNDIEYVRDNIVLAGYIDNKDLASIYNAAFALLYTSIRESFGIPLLEAMACGTPVITSNTSSMPEIAGADAALVDPLDTNNIADMMLRLEQDCDFYERIAQYGLNRAPMFSWRATAERLLALYEDVYYSNCK
ncbi:MAG: glycosyltransferase family 1 protein [Prevotella sp.]|nr:glycosyltransferase family 1 protein [Prevotella sp.]